MDALRQDLAYAIRRLRRAPGFTLVATLTLALGIGANSAIFSVVNAVLLRPLPFAEPERLVRVAQTWEHKPAVYSPQNFLDVEAQAQSFERLAAIEREDFTLTGRGAPIRVEGASVSASFFDLLRVRPLIGRFFATGENEPGRCKLAVLGERLWAERFARDASILGQTIQLNREPYVVVGVARAASSYPESAELWTPLEYDADFRTHSRGAWYLNVIGRLKPGVAVEDARREVDLVAGRLAQQYPEADQGVGGTVLGLHDSLVGGVRPALLMLLGAVGLVLLIACVNVANLLLARVAARETELAVRAALGAGRGRLLQQLMTESMLLALLGGAAGTLVAAGCLDFLVQLKPTGVPRLADVRIDRTVAIFASALSLLTGLVFGAFPALQMARRATAQALRDGGRGLLQSPGGRLRSVLVVGQMALAMMLLAGAGLLIHSFAQLRRVAPGFDPTHALSFRVSLPESAYAGDPQRAAFLEELLTRLRALPGVRAGGAVSALPLGGARFNLSFEVEGRPKLAPAQQPSMNVRVATSDYFRTMGIAVRRGRAFEPRDTALAPHVVLLSESAVRRFFPGEDPMGRRITIGWRRDDVPAGGEVVGIVADVKTDTLAEDDQPEIYLPHGQLPFGSMDVVLRSDADPLALAAGAQTVTHGLDAELPLARILPLEAVVARSISEPRFYVLLLGAFAVVALLLAAIGIFGVMSYAVTERTREIGVRVALGARPGDVLRAVLGDALLLATIGVGAGLLGALALSRVLAGLLFRLSPTDPTTLACTATVLLSVALVASYLPARRAAGVDPLVALRSE